MSSYKKLSKADVTNVPYAANKQWNLPYSCPSISNGYFNIYKGTYITGTFALDNYATDPFTNGQYERLVYNSINHLFYQSYSGSLLNTGSIMFNVDTYQSASQQRPTGAYFDYNTNPLLIKNFPTGTNAGIRVLSINQDIYGSKVLPYSFRLSSSVYYIIDDGNGNLYDAKGEVDDYILTSYISQSYFLDALPDSTHIGNVFYAHGLAVITNPDYQTMFPLSPIAVNDTATFYTTESKTINILANDISRSCALDTGSVVLSGSNSVYYTVNANGTITLNTTTIGTYDVYYTVNSLCSNGCSLTSNQAKVNVNVIQPPTSCRNYSLSNASGGSINYGYTDCSDIEIIGSLADNFAISFCAIEDSVIAPDLAGVTITNNAICTSCATYDLAGSIIATETFLYVTCSTGLPVTESGVNSTGVTRCVDPSYGVYMVTGSGTINFNSPNC
jgi:hypothetical protein